MTKHFGSEFGLSKGEVIYIIQNYDYNPSSCKNYGEIGSEIEKEKLGVIAKYVHLPMSAEFIEIRKKYHRYGDGVSTYLAALQNLLFPEDYATCQCADKPKDKTKDPLYIGVVVALRKITGYSPTDICNLLDITSEQYACIRAKVNTMFDSE